MHLILFRLCRAAAGLSQRQDRGEIRRDDYQVSSGISEDAPFGPRMP